MLTSVELRQGRFNVGLTIPQVVHDNVCENNTDEPLSAEKIAEITKLVEGCDAIIVAAGDPMLWNGNHKNATNANYKGEQRDRANLDLTFPQQQLLRAAYDTKIPVILSLVCGKPNCIPWAAENIPAILVGFNPGQEGTETAKCED